MSRNEFDSRCGGWCNLGVGISHLCKYINIFLSSKTTLGYFHYSPRTRQLTMASDAQIESSVIAQLASTEYACSSITRLNGGTANFVYRGQPNKNNHDDSSGVIIIKHTQDFVALNRSFNLDAERCVSCLLVSVRGSSLYEIGL
jgi:hypothetical protein